MKPISLKRVRFNRDDIAVLDYDTDLEFAPGEAWLSDGQVRIAHYKGVSNIVIPGTNVECAVAFDDVEPPRGPGRPKKMQ